MVFRILFLIIFVNSTLSYAQFYTKTEVSDMKKELTFPVVQSNEILERFDSAGMKGLHPRMFATEAEINRTRKLIQNGDSLMTLAWEQIKRLADETLMQPLPNGELDGAGLRVQGVHRTAVLVPPLIISYWLSGEEKYAEFAWQAFENMSHYNDWGVQTEPPYNDRHFLDTGVAGFVVSFIYDGLFHYLSDEQKGYLTDVAHKFLFNPALAQYNGSAKKTWDWNKANHNWNGICNGGVIMASLMLMEKDPDLLSQLVAYGLNDLPLYLREFEPHGQSEEGLMYWSYGLMYTLPTLDALQRVLGTDFGLSNTPGLKRAGYFPMFTTGPVATLSIGDDPVKNGRAKSLFWFSKRYEDASLAKLQYDLTLENGGEMQWFDMFYYDPSLVEKGEIVMAPLDNYVYGLELITFRSNWDRDALFLGIHGGDNHANHGHLDAGTFDIQAEGEVWAYGNLGRDDYTFPGYFSKVTLPDYLDEPSEQKNAGRWHFYRMRAEGKNCLVFNPDTRPDQNESGEARFFDFESDDEQGSVLVDLTSCYSRDVDFYTRRASIDRKNNKIRITDRFIAKEKSIVWWSMHTKANIELINDRRAVLLTQNGKSALVEIEGLDGIEFDVLPATYLPVREFPLTKNTENKGFRKLVMKIDGIKDADFSIVFTPLNDKQ